MKSTKNKIIKVIILSILLSLFFIVLSSLNAADVNMNSTNNTIANAVANETSDGDTIYLDQGTYNHSHLNGTNGININKNLTIVGQGSNQSTIDAQRLGRVFNIQSNGTLTLINLTLINGNTTGMGGTINSQGTLTMDNCVFTRNNANSYAGAIYCHFNTTLNIYDSIFTNNVGNLGGAIYSNTGALFNIINSTFINNRAIRYGGALYTQDAQGIFSGSNISNSNFINNSANVGGACSINGKTNFTIFNSTFINNIANSNGGALEDFFNTNFRLINSTFENNIATQNGGAIYSYSITHIENSNFTNNIANNGGVIYSEYDMSVNNSQFINNTANNTGGGMYNNGIMLVSQNTMTGNTALIGNAIYNNGNMGTLNLTYLNNSTITVNNNTMILLYAFLTDDMSNPVTGQNISFIANEILIGSVRVIEGFADINYFIDQQNNIIPITGDYTGHNGFNIILRNGQLLRISNTTVNSTIRLDKNEYIINETVNGTITVTNNGNVSAINVTNRVNFPSNFVLDPSSVIVSHGNFDFSTNIWSIGDLSPNEQSTMSFTGRFTTSGTYILNIITTGENFNNSMDSTTAIVNENQTTVIGNISLDKERYQVNETVQGKINVTNYGSNIAYNVIVKVNFPLEFTLNTNSIVVSHGYYDTTTNLWYIGNLNPNEEANMNFTGRFTRSGEFTISIETNGDNFETSIDLFSVIVESSEPTPTPEPEDNNNNNNNTETTNNNTNNNVNNNMNPNPIVTTTTNTTTMKEAGIPILTIILVLLTILGLIVRRK